jgi:hypothetical protein
MASRCMRHEPCQASAPSGESRCVRALRGGAYLGNGGRFPLFPWVVLSVSLRRPWATSLADVTVLTFWYHDTGRLNATGYVLPEAVFAESVKAAGVDGGGGADGGSSGAVDGDHGCGGGDGDDGEPAFRSALVFAVHDADDDVQHDQLHQCLVNDARELWKSVAPSRSGSGGGAAPALEDFCVVSTVALPHMRHRDDQFRDAYKAFGRPLTDSKASDYFCKTEFSKGIPPQKQALVLRTPLVPKSS